MAAQGSRRLIGFQADQQELRSAERCPGCNQLASRAGGMVGMPGFEPGTSCTPSRRATRLRYIPSVELHHAVRFAFRPLFVTGTRRRCRRHQFERRRRVRPVQQFEHALQSLPHVANPRSRLLVDQTKSSADVDVSSAPDSSRRRRAPANVSPST